MIVVASLATLGGSPSRRLSENWQESQLVEQFVEIFGHLRHDRSEGLACQFQSPEPNVLELAKQVVDFNSLILLPPLNLKLGAEPIGQKTDADVIAHASLAADPTSACRVDGLFGNYGKTWRKHHAGYSEAELATLPRVTTETGVTIEGPITEQVQACLYLSAYLDQFKRGWKHTAVYLLRDRTDEGGNQTFGFYRPGYTPRLAATYLHDLTTILADKSSQSPPGTLNYSIPNQAATVHDLLLQKADGTFELVVWAERFTGGSESISVELRKPPGSVRLFDPTVNVSSVQTLSSATSISLTLSNHPVVIYLSASPH